MTSSGVLLHGQSNMGLAHQIAIHRRIHAVTSGAVSVFGNRNGGDPSSDWTGATPPYARAANYTSMVGYARGQRFDKLALIWFQGESDATAELAAVYPAKLDALRTWITEDMLNTGGTLYTVFCLPWKTGAGGAAEGYGNGGPGDIIRSHFNDLAAANPATTVAVETSSYTRTDGVHIDDDVCLSTSGTAIANAALTLLGF